MNFKPDKISEQKLKRVLIISDTHYGFNENTSNITCNCLNKMTLENPELIIHLGDWISHEQEQLEEILSLYRKYFPKIPIVGVRGNHDMWSNSVYDFESNTRFFQNLSDLDKRQKELFKKYNIHHLENNPYETTNFVIFGFDGWYFSKNPPTKDRSKMVSKVGKKDTNEYLYKKAEKEFKNILKIKKNYIKKTILATHLATFTENPKYLTMCANPQWHDTIINNFDFYLVGHSHVIHNFIEKNCKVINPGGDYNRPNYVVIDL